MYDLVSSIRAHILCALPVPSARRAHQRRVDEAHANGSARVDRQLLVDVSTIIRNDDRTGIQRVVRALLLQLSVRPPAGFRVRPVFAARRHGYRYAPEIADLATAQPAELGRACAVSVKRGDLFLGLDLAAHLLPRRRAELAAWKLRGVTINVVVYDLLPVLHPEWFNPKNTRNIRRWLRTIAVLADRLICISHTVRKDLEAWMLRKYSLPVGTVPVSVIPLGADIESSLPSSGLPENTDKLLSALAGRPTVLMVGTLEPRKGHGEVLGAFDDLWKQGREVNLVIIGKPGWRIGHLLASLRSHPRHQAGLYWLENASDELLMLLYATCTGVIVASHAEGFGLSLIEALNYGKHVLARDVPVSREIGGTSVSYFSGSAALANELALWLDQIQCNRMPPAMPRYSWQSSASELCRCLGLQQPVAQQPHPAPTAYVSAQETIV